MGNLWLDKELFYDYIVFYWYYILHVIKNNYVPLYLNIKRNIIYKKIYEVNIDILKLLATKCEKFKLDIDEETKLINMKEDKTKKYYLNISKIDL